MCCSFPKLEAFLTEVSRCNTIASIAIPHKSLKDTTLNGYFIPRNTTIMVSIWAVLQDKSIWNNPEKFSPERFLDDEGNYKKTDGWMPVFGFGKLWKILF